MNEKSRTLTRKKRIPVSGHRDILKVRGGDPGYHYRWVNDTENRIERFKEGGYELVENEDGLTTGQRTVNSADAPSTIVSKKVGNNTTAYLMRIKREWYEEDQAARNRRIDESEEDMKRNLNSGNDGTYGKVNFER